MRNPGPGCRVSRPGLPPFDGRLAERPIVDRDDAGLPFSLLRGDLMRALLQAVLFWLFHPWYDKKDPS